MTKTHYDSKRNIVTVELEGNVDGTQAERFLSDIHQVLPKCGKGFTLLTDLSGVKHMDAGVKEAVKKGMDLFNERGVTRILRVIPDPAQDIGFSIMSLFHYSKTVKFVTVQSREEAETRLKEWSE